MANPIFTAKVDSKGRITIRSDVREDRKIKAGDRVRIYGIQKVEVI